MKKIVNNVLYDTTTSKKITSTTQSNKYQPNKNYTTTLFKSGRKQFFIYRENCGIPEPFYIFPISIEEAKEFVIQFGTIQEYELAFGKIKQIVPFEKRTKKKTKETVRIFLETKDLTAFCKTLRRFGIVTQHDIYYIIREAFSDRYLARFGLHARDIAYGMLHGNLNTKQKPLSTSYSNEWTFIKQMKEQPFEYRKILFTTRYYIYWCNQSCKTSDKSKILWRINTIENRKRMELINKYLLKN